MAVANTTSAVVYAYPNAALPEIEGPLTPILPPYGFVVGGGTDYTVPLYTRLRALATANDPSSAELFFAFLTPYGPPFHAWTEADRAAMAALGPEREDYMPNSMRLTLITMCRQLRNGPHMRRLLPYVRPSTLERHMLLLPYPATACASEPEFKQNATYTPASIPRWVRRILLQLDFDNLVGPDELRWGDFGRTLSVPYMSSVRWSAAWRAAEAGDGAGGAEAPLLPPWNAAHAASRTSLVCFTGSLRGQPTSMQIRQRLVTACQAAPRALCSSLVSTHFPIFGPAQSTRGQATTLRKALSLKRRATFCLEPPGFSPPRKSMLDSLLSGCIPVLFYERHQCTPPPMWPRTRTPRLLSHSRRRMHTAPHASHAPHAAHAAPHAPHACAARAARAARMRRTRRTHAPHAPHAPHACAARATVAATWPRSACLLEPKAVGNRRPPPRGVGGASGGGAHHLCRRERPPGCVLIHACGA